MEFQTSKPSNRFFATRAAPRALMVNLKTRDIEATSARRAKDQGASHTAGNYLIEFGGSLSLQKARTRLAVVVPGNLALIFGSYSWNSAACGKR